MKQCYWFVHDEGVCCSEGTHRSDKGVHHDEGTLFRDEGVHRSELEEQKMKKLWVRRGEGPFVVAKVVGPSNTTFHISSFRRPI